VKQVAVLILYKNVLFVGRLSVSFLMIDTQRDVKLKKNCILLLVCKHTLRGYSMNYFRFIGIEVWAVGRYALVFCTELLVQFSAVGRPVLRSVELCLISSTQPRALLLFTRRATLSCEGEMSVFFFLFCCTRL
jgi:hypothetical protein